MNYRISLSAVHIPEETYPLMEASLRAGLVSHSAYVEQFEQAICEYVGARYCIAVSNGTMADAVAVAAMKIAIPTLTRAVVPALTFIAQPNSVRYNNLDVVFSDVDESWNIDLCWYFDRHAPDQTTLLFGTDLMGRPLGKVDTRGVPMIEDACEAFGSRKDGEYAGTFGLLGTYSFFPSHTISTGEGGAIVTNDPELAYLCRSVRSHGAVSVDPMDKFSFPYPGYNARMTTMQAVLGIALMMHIDEYVSRRYEIFKLMQKSVGGFEENGDTIIPHGFPLAFQSEGARDRAMMQFLDAGVECRKFFSCIPSAEKPYQQPGIFPVAERVSKTHLYLPCHQNMIPEDVRYISGLLGDIKERV